MTCIAIGTLLLTVLMNIYLCHASLNPNGAHVQTRYEAYYVQVQTSRYTYSLWRVCKEVCNFWCWGKKRVCRNERRGKWVTYYKTVKRYRPHYFCASGYRRTGSSCSDINECNTSRNRCRHKPGCINTSGSYRCTCPAGYLLDTDRRTCNDIDECSRNTRMCSFKKECQNTQGSYKCTCPVGYYLENDQRTCKGHCNRRFEKLNRACDTCDDTTLTGTVKNNAGLFLHNASIVFSEFPFKILAKTNVSGHFTLKGVCKSDDYVIVSKHGYLSQIIKTTKTNRTVTAVLKKLVQSVTPVILQSTELVENINDDWYPDLEASVCYVKVAVENIDDCPNKTTSFRVESVIGKEQHSAGYVVITMTEFNSTACAEYKCPQTNDHDVMVKVVPLAPGWFTRDQSTTRKFIDDLKPSILSNYFTFKPEIYLRDPRIGVYHSDEKVFTDENVEKNKKKAHCMEERFTAGVRFRYCSKLCKTGKPNSACDACVCDDNTLTGTVKNDAGVLLDNAAIVLSEFPLRILARTDISGHFTLRGVCISEGYVIVSRHGYLAQIIKMTKINSSKATVTAVLKAIGI